MEGIQEVVTAIDRLIGIFGLSSAITGYVLARSFLHLKKAWYASRFFWLGLIGNLPALVGIVAYIFLRLQRGDVEEGETSASTAGTQ